MQHDSNLIIPLRIWSELLNELHRRTEECHESGAFLLGHTRGKSRYVERVIYYDDLDPNAYRTGVVTMHAASFGRLWDLCRSGGMSVVADIHVHPKHAFQSIADQHNPMIALSGHLALIVPWFARYPAKLNEFGFFEYRGGRRWRPLGGEHITKFLHIEP